MSEEQDWKNLNTIDKIEHKNWNARVEGYKEALSEMSKANDSKDPLFNSYLGVMKKMVLDSNVVAQEKALEVVLYFVEEAHVAGKVAGEMCTGLVTKCLSSARPTTRERAVAAIKMLIEIEKHEAVIEELMKGLSSKTPKVVVGCITVIRESLREFGPKIIPVKELFKVLPQLLEDRDKGVREAGKELIVEIYRWIGKQAITPQLSNFKPVQVTELNSEFEKMSTEKAFPTRYLRSQKPKVVAQAKSATGGNEISTNAALNALVEPAVDPYDFIDPVEVISKVPNDFYDKIEEKKWTDRKDALEVIEKLTNHEKLVPGDFGDLIKALLKVLSKDTNVVLVVLAAKILYQISHGLRKKYSQYATLTIQTCLEKFKEKKANVVKALRDCIDASFYASNWESISEDVVNALAHKTPSVRSETCLFLNRVFEKSTMETLQKKHLKAFVPNIVKLCQDSLPEVRDASFLVLGTAMMVVTEKNIKPYMEGIDAVKTARIMECYEKAKANANESVKAPVVAVVEPVKVKEEAKPKSEKSSVTKAPPKKVAAVQKTQKKPGANNAESEIPKEPLMSDDDVTAKGTELFGEAFMTQIADKSFNERLAAVQTLQDFIKDKSSTEIPSQLIIKLILLKPGLKDNNVQVLKNKFELIKSIVMNGKFTLTIAELCIGDHTEKIGDPKSGDIVKATLTEMSDSLNLQCVATQVIKTASENVNVKNIAEALVWIGNAIKDFGFKIAMNDLLPFIRTGLQHTNPSVRQSALKLVGIVSLYVRDLISTLLKDEKSSIKQLIDQEVESMKAQEPPLPTRGLKNAKPTAAGDTDHDVTAAVAHVDIDREDLIPRENISSKITEDMLTQLLDKSWKVKKEALDEITKILDKCTGIYGDGLQPLMAAVSKITTDSSKVISKIALTMLSTICKLLTKKDSERFVKIIMPALLSSCSDAKPKNREDSVATINTWVEKVGFPAIAEGGMIVDALKVDSPFQKAEILSLISPHLTTISENKLLKKALPSEFGPDILPLLYACLEERSADVRNKAKDAVLPFMLVYGYEEMLKIHSKNTKAASKDNIKAYLDASKKNLPTPAVSAVKPVDKTPAEAAKAAPVGKKESLSKKAVEENAVTKVKRGDEKRGSVGKLSTKETDTGKPDEIAPLLQTSSDKKKRLIEDSKKKNLTKAEIAQQINTNFTGNCNQELMNNLFSTDFKKHIVAIDLLSRFLNEENPYSIEATKQNLDLILKWLVVRFDETNTSVVNKGLEYLIQLFTILPKDENFSLHTQEANNFIPEFLLKLGDGNVNIRSNAHKIMKLLLNCYQAKFVVPFIERVLFETKLAKVKQGCSEFTQLLIDDRRIKLAENIPLLVSISKMICERDNSIRTAAIDCLVSAHNHMGEKLFDKLKELSEKDRSMLAERIKRTGKPVQPGTESSLATTSTATTTSTEKSLKPAQNQQKPTSAAGQSAPLKPASFDTNPILREEVGLKLINVDEEIKELLQPLEKLTLRFSGRISQTVNSNDAITSVIHSINSNDVQTSIQAMAQIDEVIKNQDVRPQLLTFMDNLVMSITMQLKATLGKLSEERFNESEITDMFKGMLATLVSIFSYKDLAAELNRDRLMSLMQVILRLVINDQLVALSEGGTIIRGINILSVKILEFSNQTRMLSSLLRMMMDCLKNNDSASKYLQLIFKCIWSMTKNLVKTVNTIDLVVILKDIQTFYNDFPPHIWESSNQDVPMRTVKTIVYSIINHKGSGVLEALYQIPNAPGKELDQYIRKSYAKLKYPIPAVLPTAVDVMDAPQTQKSVEKHQNIPKTTTRPYLDELKQIFQKIGDPRDTKEGLNHLFDFKIKYPHVDLTRYLSQTSAYFQRTIESGLQTIAVERGQPMISLHGSNESSQLNNSGATALLDKDSMAYCDMDPDTLLRRLKDLRIKAGLDKPRAEQPQVTSPLKDEMEMSTIGPLNPSGDGPPAVVPNQNRRMSAQDLNQYRQRLNNVAKNPR